MKKIYLTLSVLFVANLANAINEVPNSSFTDWASDSPDGWSTNNVPGYLTTVTQVNPGYTDNSAAKGQSVIYFTDTIPPILSTIGSGYGTAINADYNDLTFYYKASLLNGDQFIASVFIYDASHNIIGLGTATITDNMSGFGVSHINITYINELVVAATALIIFTLEGDPNSSSSTNPASYFVVDDVSLNLVAKVDELTSTPKLDIFPNPAHGLITIKNGEDRSNEHVLTLIDASGRVVMTKNDKSTGHPFSTDVDLQGIAPGSYYLLVNTNEQTLLKRIAVQ